MEHSYVGGEILASISHRNVDNPLRGQIVDSYIVALGFKPTIRRQAQTQKGSSGDKDRWVEASRETPSRNLFLQRLSEAAMNQNSPAWRAGSAAS